VWFAHGKGSEFEVHQTKWPALGLDRRALPVS